MSILLSVNPPYAGWLVDGEKTIEWRKKPLPEGKAYIYETKKNGGCGMVIGEVEIQGIYNVSAITLPKAWVKFGKVSRAKLQTYSKGKPFYGNSCFEPERYDKPIPLSDFRLPCNWNYDCFTCKWWNPDKYESFCKRSEPLTRPPQSWCYVDDSVLGNPGWSVPKAELHECKDCARYDECKDHVIPNETFWEVGGCKAFERKEDEV